MLICLESQPMQFLVDLASHLEVALARSTALLWCSTDVFKVQGFFIRHIINYTGYNQKWNVIKCNKCNHFWTELHFKLFLYWQNPQILHQWLVTGGQSNSGYIWIWVGVVGMLILCNVSQKWMKSLFTMLCSLHFEDYFQKVCFQAPKIPFVL